MLSVLALIAPVQLGEPADPNVTPEHIKSEWYFFAVFRWLKLTSFEIGILGTIIGVGIFMFWPFIDRLLERSFPRMQMSTWIGLIGVLVLIIFTFWEALV